MMSYINPKQHVLIEQLHLQALPLNIADTKTLLPQVWQIEHCDSSNDVIHQLADQGFPEGTVVIAEQQSSGRGRRGSPWYSHPSNLHFSMLLRPEQETSQLPLLNLIFSYATLKAIHYQYRLPILIKWPNDLLVRGRKVAGVMSERRNTMDSESSHIALGCGLNTNHDKGSLPSELAGTTTSLRMELNQQVNHENLLAAILLHFDELYTRFKLDTQ